MDQYKDLVAAQIVRNKHVQPEVHKGTHVEKE